MIVPGSTEPNPDDYHTRPQPAVYTSHLMKQFGTAKVLNNIDLNLNWNSCLAVFGHNGAGKSTLLRILATLAKPSSGIVSISGYDIKRHANVIRTITGYLGHQLHLYRNLTVRENLHFFGKLYSLNNNNSSVNRMRHQ